MMRRIERPGTRAGDQEKDATHDLRVLRSDLVQDGPHADLGRDRGWGERQGAQEEPRLGGKHRHEHLDDERNRHQPRAEAEHQQESPEDLQPPHEWGRHKRKRYPELGESPHPLIDVDELQYPLPEEDPSRHQAEDHRRARSRHRRAKKPRPQVLDHAITPSIHPCITFRTRSRNTRYYTDVHPSDGLSPPTP